MSAEETAEQSGESSLRVVRGRADAVDLAALLAVLHVAARSAQGASAATAARPGRAGWAKARRVAHRPAGSWKSY